MKRRLASSRTKDSVQKAHRKSTRVFRLAATAEEVSHEPTIPRIQTESATSNAARGTEHPQGATSRKMPVGTRQVVSCTRKDPSSTCRKQLRLSETSLRGKGGGRSRCGSSVSPTAELGKSSAAPMPPGRSPRVTRFREGERARSKAVEGKQSGPMDVSGCEETILANFLFPATQPRGWVDPAIRSAQQIWDTAGQEKYHSLAPMYNRGAGTAIVVYDITKMNSFRTLKEWINELQAQGPQDIAIAIAGNKRDLESERVESSVARAYADDIGTMFVETSAKTDTQVQDVFVELSKRLPKREPAQPAADTLDLDSAGGSSSVCC